MSPKTKSKQLTERKREIQTMKNTLTLNTLTLNMTKNIIRTYKTAYNRSTEWKPLRREIDGLIAIANKFNYQTAYEYIVYGLAMENGYDRDSVKSLFDNLARFEYVIALGQKDMGDALDIHIAKRMACIFD